MACFISRLVVSLPLRGHLVAFSSPSPPLRPLSSRQGPRAWVEADAERAGVLGHRRDEAGHSASPAGDLNALQWRTSLRAARGKVSPSGLREEPDRDLLADTRFVSQTPVTLLAEAGMGSDGSASSLGTDGRFQSHPGLGSNAGSTACLPCDLGQGSSLSEPQFSHLQNESNHSRGVLEVSVAGTQYALKD